MGIPWMDSIKQKGQLTLQTVDEDSWGPLKAALDEAITEFNVNSKKNKLCVKYVKAQEGTVNVQVVATEGPTISFEYEGTSKSEEFSGKRLHGRTFQASRDGKLEKAFVFLPKTPEINTPSGLRPAGAGVLKMIALHELLHAAGLEDGDHTHDDVFQGNPQPYPGSNPSEDGLMIGSSTRHMPPTIVQKSTIQGIKALWCPPGGKLTASVHYKKH